MKPYPGRPLILHPRKHTQTQRRGLFKSSTFPQYPQKQKVLSSASTSIYSLTMIATTQTLVNNNGCSCSCSDSCCTTSYVYVSIAHHPCQCRRQHIADSIFLLGAPARAARASAKHTLPYRVQCSVERRGDEITLVTIFISTLEWM
ncbi:hypothetical protein FA13DRAFT_1074179 [Coprinellus micaceus]|uniref:Uncharacterized protein n=1 Tax=Coprinellus micaceus TaxID=71717 RepID=A0A4Y7TSV4_COPMI|nr:hypothetical protein FA13DRAFT_1074179 [Coprinellus micaceus]